MKALYYISGVALLTLGSCSAGLYVGSEYDDLYFKASDQPVTRVQPATNQAVVEKNLQSGDYYNNIYAADTLVSEDFADAVDYDDANLYDNNYNYNDFSYAGRLRSFHNSYFYPYWSDPFYYSYYPSFGLGLYSGFPYYGSYYSPYYNPYFYDYYDPFYSYGGFYGSYYYGGLYNRFYSPYYSYYSPYYGYGSYYRYGDEGGVSYGRRERPSTLSTRWTGGSAGSPSGASSRRGGSIATGSGNINSTTPVYNSQGVTSGTRRTVSQSGSQQQVVSTNRNTVQRSVKTGSESNSAIQSRRTVTSRPEYNSATRSYTPSYSNPRVSTRPSYNNTRVNSEAGQNRVINSTNTERRSINTNRTNSGQRYNQGSSTIRRSNSSYSPGQLRSSSPNIGSSYSAPARRSYSSGSSYSSPSGGSYRSSGSGSSGSSSFSSGSSSSGSSSRSSSGGSSSSGGGRRH